MKSFVQFLTEDYVGVYDMINEVLDNNYTDAEIDESFDEINLIFEANKFNKDMKQYLIRFNKKHAKFAADEKAMWERLHKLHDEETIKIYKAWLGDDFDHRKPEDMKKLSKEQIDHTDKIVDAAWNVYKKQAANEMAQLIAKYSDDFDDQSSLDFAFLQLVRIKEAITKSFKQGAKVFKNMPDDVKQQWAPKYTSSAIQEINVLINSLKLAVKNIKEKADFDISDDLNEMAKKMKLSFIGFKNGTWTGGDIDLSGYIKQFNEKFLGVKSDDAKTDDSSEESDNGSSEASDESSNTAEEVTSSEVSDVVSDNKDLLTPLAKAANVKGDQLVNIVTKLCKGRKLEETTITGLCVILCGTLLSVKKSGKGDKKAVAIVIDKIAKVVNNSKRGIRDILK